MTREEEIINVAFEERSEQILICKWAFMDGAKWADENPRKGLIEIDKACEWLEQVFIEYAGYYCAQEILDGFRKAMKGE